MTDSDEIIDESGPVSDPSPSGTDDTVFGAVGAMVGMVAAIAFTALAFFANEIRSADVDPQFIRLIGERTSRFGGTYYQNSLHNKGPFDALLYHVPREVLGFDAYWYGISFFILIGTGLLALATSRVTRVHDVPASAGVAVGLIAFFHFALVRADYSGVMYSRNETAYILAAVWLILLVPKWWTPRRSIWSVAAIGALFGLAAQTLLSAAIECAVIGGLVIWVVFDRVEQARRIRHLVVGASTAAGVFVAAPLWYLARGSFDEFWAGWWTYASWQSSATDLTLVDKFQRGWDQMTAYYGDYPLSLFIVVGFVFLTWLFWKQLSRWQRAVHITAGVWLLAGWLELVLSWRYSSHYFAVIAVPTMFIAALLVGHGLTLIARVKPLKLAPLFPLMAVVFSFVYFHHNRVDEGYQSIRHYHSPAELAELRRANTDGNIRTVRAVLDVVSGDDDPLLMWTNTPTPYLEVRRVPASRMAWYTFLVGDIYLGNKGPQYVLPQTWDWFAEDMAQTTPAAEWEAKDVPHDPDLPFGEYVASNMRPMYDGSVDTVYVRNDLAEQMTSGALDTGLGSGLDVPEQPEVDERIELGAGYCRAVELTLQGDPTEQMVTFHLGGTDFADRTLTLGSEGISGKDDGDVTDTATLPDAEDGTRTVRVVLGHRSAVLVVDGVIAGAVELFAEQPTLSVVVDQEGLTISDVRAGEAEWAARC
ncbi:MAG: hypothetical protein HY828_16530 [Actinobacteria bacterium]|nr:hypothetical protein [Actinomycetota bacterium]